MKYLNLIGVIWQCHQCKHSNTFNVDNILTCGYCRYYLLHIKILKLFLMVLLIFYPQLFLRWIKHLNIAWPPCRVWRLYAYEADSLYKTKIINNLKKSLCNLDFKFSTSTVLDLTCFRMISKVNWNSQHKSSEHSTIICSSIILRVYIL